MLRIHSLMIVFIILHSTISQPYSRTIIPVYKTCGGIQLALNVASTGDTIQLDSGEYTISRTVDVKTGVVIIGKGPQNTVLHHSAKRKDEFWVFRVDGLNQLPIRMSGFAIEGRSPDATPGIKLVNNCRDFRIDHCLFEKCSRRAIEVHGKTCGVIDHSVFKENWYTSIVVYGNGESEWNKELTIGDSDAIFVEDNYFEQSEIPEISMAHHIASNNGSHYVFRYNTIKDGKIASHAIDTHGNKFGSERGSRSYEIYNNTVYAIHRWAGINIRGGDGVIFNNKFKGDYVSPIHLMHEGRQGDGECNYPCLDQIRQLYIWGNTYNGKLVDVYIRFPLIVQKDRDYFLHKKPGYTPFVYPHPLVK